MNRQKSFENEIPTLYLVATPIGNLDEMTYRSINTLKNVKYIAAEDTRNTVKLLNHFEISTKLISHHEHNIKQSIPKLIQLLEEGNDIALVSDAGYPAISDPGYELVKEAIEHEINVVPISGCNACLDALVVSGIAPQPFMFYGFLDHLDKKKKKELIDLKKEYLTLYQTYKNLNQKYLSLTKEELAIKLSDIALGQDAANAIMAGSYLLVIIFGAVISGFGLGLALKKGASTGGVDIIQQILLDRFKIPFSISLLMIDGTIVTVAAIYFKDFFMILYGFLFIYLSGVVLDAIVFSGFNSRAVYIITSDPEAVKNKIYSVLERGVTEIYSRGGYRQEDKKMLVCVMSNNEFYKMKTLILEIDKRAFIFVARVSEVHGEGFTYDSPEQVEKENEPSK